MDPRLAEEPATRWDRLVAVLEDVDPERVIDASHIIERERKLNMTDLELFYVLAMHYQDCQSRVLDEVLSLYVLIDTWMEWLARCSHCLSHQRTFDKLGGNGGGSRSCAKCDAACRAACESSVSVHHRLRPVSAGSRVFTPPDGDLSDSLTGSVTGSVVPSSVNSPLTRSVTTTPAVTTTHESPSLPGQCGVSQRTQKGHCTAALSAEAQPSQEHKKDGDSARGAAAVPASHGRASDAKQASATGSAQASSSLKKAPVSQSRMDPSASFLDKYSLPPNWTAEGSVSFLRDGRILSDLIEEALSVTTKSMNELEAMAGTHNASPTMAAFNQRFPSLADIDRLASRTQDNRSNMSFGHLHNVTVTHAKPRGSRRSKTSRAMRIMEAQGKTVVETEKAVSRLNHLCEDWLGWVRAENGGEHFFDLLSSDRMLRPRNADDYWFVHRLHWLAVALFKTVGDPAIVPLPPRVSFLLLRQHPGIPVDDAEENSELAMLIATKCSCLPHNSKLQLVVVDGNVIKVSHPQAHPQPLRFPCCVVDGEAFAFVENKNGFSPLWHILRRLLQKWDDTQWRFELPIMDHRADQVLQVGTAASPLSTVTPSRLTGTKSSRPPSLVLVDGKTAATRQPHQPERVEEGSPLASPSTPNPAGASGAATSLSRTRGNDSTAPQSRASSANKHTATSFNLTIKASSLRPGRTTGNLSFSQISGESPVTNVSAGGNGATGSGTFPAAPIRALVTQRGSRPFADELAEDGIAASFGAVSMVRGGRRALTPQQAFQSGQESTSSLTPERSCSQTRYPLSSAVRTVRGSMSSQLTEGKDSSNAAAESPIVASAVKNVATFAATAIVGASKERTEGSVKPQLSAAAKAQSFPAAATSRTPLVGSAAQATSPLLSPTLLTGASFSKGPCSVRAAGCEQASDPAATVRNSGVAAADTNLLLQAAATGNVDVEKETDVPEDLKTCGSDPDEEDSTEEMDEERSGSTTLLASATLSAVHPTTEVNVQVAPLMNDDRCCAGSFRDETLTPPHEDYEGSQINNQDHCSYSEVLRVKNFSATVVQERQGSGIDIRDHQFRVSGRPVGKGAFGAVYRALDLETGVIVAVKQSRYSIDTKDQNHLNWREFQTWSMLPAHPNVITFYGASKEAETSQLLLVLEFASGGSIVAMYQHFRPIPEHLFLQHASGIALGLKHLHDHNVIHGDMKPENVLTRSDGSVAITDFGCSRLTLRSPTEERGDGGRSDPSSSARHSSDSSVGPWQLFGTAAFMAPEVITNEPDFKSDVWAYVCTLAYLWLGRVPWSEVPETREVQDSIPLMFFIATHEDAIPFTQEQLAQTPRWMQRLAQRGFMHEVEKRANMAEVISILSEYN